MSKPNRVLANLPKNPFELVLQSRSETAVEQRMAEDAAGGFEVKMTSVRMGATKRSWREFRAWRREPVVKG